MCVLSSKNVFVEFRVVFAGSLAKCASHCQVLYICCKNWCSLEEHHTSEVAGVTAWVADFVLGRCAWLAEWRL